MRRARRYEAAAAAVALMLAAAGCAGPFDARELPETEPWLVAVKSCHLPPHNGWIPSLAHHAWFDIKRGREDRWLRLEIVGWEAFSERYLLHETRLSAEEAREPQREHQDIYLHGLVRGDTAMHLAERLLDEALRYEDASHYRVWPGPNSNAFVARMLHRIDWPVELPHNAVGKDYAPIADAGLASGGTGIRIDTLLVGAEVGLREGIQLHFLQLTLGVDLWPPALLVPFVPRLGF